MTDLYSISKKLKEQFSHWNFPVCKGFFTKYISVESRQQIIFTIWVNKQSGHKEILDEVNLSSKNHWKMRWKTQTFHWTKYRSINNRLGSGYLDKINSEMKLGLKERQMLRQRLEEFLKEFHIT